MARSLFSSSWYRVADQKPRLRSHAELHRHWIRGQVWYILQDHQTGRFHRVSPAANLMICLMDGRRTLAEIWDIVGRRVGDDPPTQDEAIQLLAQLHSSDLLQGDSLPDLGEISERSDTQERRKLIQRLRSPLSMRFPLLDPDRFLEATLPLVRPFFTRIGFLLWLALVLTGVVLAILHWPELLSDEFDRVLTGQNLLIIALVYPVVKALHEAGHAYATKVWGGEVHEFGIMLLVAVPMPYVDASASAAFREKSRRMIVGGAGIMVELALAALAMIVWVEASPGLVRAFAFNVMLIGGVSTLLFNGNPLLRYDGYYIFSDWIDIPNLGTRGSRYLAYLTQRYLFGLDWIQSPVTADSERPWLFVYAVASFAYRIVIIVGIALFVANRFFVIGIMLAIWAVAGMVLLPIYKGLRYLLFSPQLGEHRPRAVMVTGGITAAILILLFAIPVPHATVAQGVVWIPDDASVRARDEGVVSEILSSPNSAVAAGKPLIVLADPILPANAAVQQAELREMKLRLDAARVIDRVQTDMLQEQVKHLEAVLALTRQREADLVIRAEKPGQFLVPEATDLVGRFVKKGDLLGYVMGEHDPVLRVIVTQSDIDMVRQRTGRVEVRFVEDLAKVYPAVIKREVPGAAQDVPSLALTTEGGGSIALDPSAKSKGQTLQRLFQFEVGLGADLPPQSLGSRVYVRFDHGREAIAWSLLRSLRQVFLTSFHV